MYIWRVRYLADVDNSAIMVELIWHLIQILLLIPFRCTVSNALELEEGH